MNKTQASALSAVADIADGSSIAVGGFGLCGIPQQLINALTETGATNLEVVSNNCGVDGVGLGRLVENRQIRRAKASYVGENAELVRQYFAGEIELELIPQGTLAERLRAGGSGIPAFYTPAGVSTQVADGGLVIRHASAARSTLASSPRERRQFGGVDYILEHWIKTDYALVHAEVGDTHGNLVYAASAKNFNPLVAMAGRVTIAEVERLVEPGRIDPHDVDTPSIFVDRIVCTGVGELPIEKRTTNADAGPSGSYGPRSSVRIS